LAEAVKDMGQEFRRYATARIAHADHDPPAVRPEPQPDAPALVREFDRVREQVPGDLL
jgi:hypothetical protein